MTERDKGNIDPILATIPSSPPVEITTGIDDSSMLSPLALNPDPLYLMLGESLEGADLMFPAFTQVVLEGQILGDPEQIIIEGEQIELPLITEEPSVSTPEPDGSMPQESLESDSNSTFDAALDLIRTSTQEHDLHEGEDQAIDKTRINAELINIVPPDIYNKVGSVIKDQLSSGAKTADEIKDAVSERFREIPLDLVTQIISSFDETGYIRTTAKGTIKLTSIGKKRHALGFWELKGVFASSDALSTSHKPIESWDDVITAQDASRDRFRVPDVEIKSSKKNRTLWLDGIITGSSVSDSRFVKQVIETVKELPEKERPDAIVVGNIVEGTHKHTNVDATVGLSLSSSEDQFRASKELIEMLREIGVPIIYVMGVNDRNHIRDGAIEAVKVIRSAANPLRDSEKGSYMTFEDIHKIESSREYPMHKIFEHDVVFEYMLRNGRGLKSADEVEAFTKGGIRMEEYLMLWEAHQALSIAWEAHEEDEAFIPAEIVPAAFQQIVDVNNIPGPWLRDSFTVTDGANISMQSKKDSEVTQWVRNRFKMDGPTIHQEIMRIPTMISKELVINGELVPDLLVGTGNYEGIITATRHGAIMDLPGMVSSRDVIDQQGMYAQSGKNPAMRALYTRGRPSEPGAIMTSLKDGVMEVSFFDEKLLALSESVPETTIYATLNDWQIGSPTTDFRRGIHWVRHVVKDLPNRGHVRLMPLGDLTHGATVYSKFMNEAPALGLHRVPDQFDMFDAVLKGTTSDLSHRQIQGLIEKIVGAVGNHEFDGSSYDKTGINGVRETDMSFRDWYGVDRNDPRVSISERILTREGDFLDSHLALDKVGEILVAGQHKILGKGGKGATPGMPVYQAIDLLRGLGLTAEQINIALFAHWHHFQALLHQHKLMAVAPALAKQSSFEMGLGYQAVTGGMAVMIEPNRPVKILHYNADALDRISPKGGSFSQKSLNEEGFYDSPNFDPATDSLLVPTSAINKKIHQIRNDILTRHIEIR